MQHTHLAPTLHLLPQHTQLGVQRRTGRLDALPLARLRLRPSPLHEQHEVRLPCRVQLSHSRRPRAVIPPDSPTLATHARRCNHLQGVQGCPPMVLCFLHRPVQASGTILLAHVLAPWALVHRLGRRRCRRSCRSCRPFVRLELAHLGRQVLDTFSNKQDQMRTSLVVPSRERNATSNMVPLPRSWRALTHHCFPDSPLWWQLHSAAGWYLPGLQAAPPFCPAPAAPSQLGVRLP